MHDIARDTIATGLWSLKQCYLQFETQCSTAYRNAFDRSDCSQLSQKVAQCSLHLLRVLSVFGQKTFYIHTGFW